MKSRARYDGVMTMGIGRFTVSLEAVVHEILTVSFSTVAPGPLTAAAPHPSPGVPSHYGSRKPRVTN